MDDPIIVETWEVEPAGNTEGNILDIAYTKSMFSKPEDVAFYRGTLADEHKCILKRRLQTRIIGE